MRAAKKNEFPKLVSKICIPRKSQSDEKRSLGPPRIIGQTTGQTTITPRFTRRPEEETERSKLDNFVNEEGKNQEGKKHKVTSREPVARPLAAEEPERVKPINTLGNGRTKRGRDIEVKQRTNT